jgi:hypothetical protein
LIGKLDLRIQKSVQQHRQDAILLQVLNHPVPGFAGGQACAPQPGRKDHPALFAGAFVGEDKGDKLLDKLMDKCWLALQFILINF